MKPEDLRTEWLPQLKIHTVFVPTDFCAPIWSNQILLFVFLSGKDLVSEPTSQVAQTKTGERLDVLESNCLSCSSLVYTFLCVLGRRTLRVGNGRWRTTVRSGGAVKEIRRQRRWESRTRNRDRRAWPPRWSRAVTVDTL